MASVQEITHEDEGGDQNSLSMFMQTLEAMLYAVKTLFPECDYIQEKYEEFLSIAKPNPIIHKIIITKWHECLHPYYSACKLRDIATLLQSKLELFNDLDIEGKWKDPRFADSEENREGLWKYILTANAHAHAHWVADKFIPEDIREKFQTVTRELQSENNIDLSQPVDAATCMQLGIQSIQKMGPDVMSQLGRNVLSDPNGLASIMQMWQSQPNMAAAAGVGGGEGMEQMFSMVLQSMATTQLGGAAAEQ